jgi:hypothetical protein
MNDVIATEQEGLTLQTAIEFAHQNDIWPSSRNIATLLGYKRPKLNGRMNWERKRLLRELYGF